MSALRETTHPNVGDHRFVAVPTATTSVTFNMASSNTSSSDTSTDVYFDNLATSVTQFDVVADQAVQITKINGTTLTDPIVVNANATYQESQGLYTSVTVKTTVNNTNISLRAR